MTRRKVIPVRTVQTTDHETAIVRPDFGRELGVLYFLEVAERYGYRLISVGAPYPAKEERP